MPSINNYLQGFQDGLPGMKDYQHASRLYLDDNFKLLPKQKFLFHVVFNTDESLFVNGFERNEKLQLNMLVKQCDLPKYDMSYEEKVQYNKKMYAATRIAYEPVNITFHDDHADTVNAFWKKYYEYNIADPVGMNADNVISPTKDDYFDAIDSRATNKFGMDTPRKRKKTVFEGCGDICFTQTKIHIYDIGKSCHRFFLTRQSRPGRRCWCVEQHYANFI